MMAGAGDLDRKIVIERATYADDGFSTSAPSWSTLTTVRASRHDLRDTERQSLDQVNAVLAARFVVRSSAVTRTVNAKDRIKYGQTFTSPPADAYWQIVGVKETRKGRLHWIEITAVRESD